MTELAEARSESAPAPTAPPKQGSKILVAPGAEKIEPAFWKAMVHAQGVRPSVLVWNGFRADQVPADCQRWKVEARTSHWSDVASSHRGVIVPGCGLPTLASIANLGSGGCPPSQVAVAALALGLPVFVDNSCFEAFRRHSSRLAGGLVRRFEEFHRIVSSFGIVFGSSSDLAGFMKSLAPNGDGGDSPVVRSSEGRDVITVEDVEAVRRAGRTSLPVAMGTIVTPLAAQRASEWGIEVSFQ